MTESEVTWTTEIPPASIDVDFEAQQASLHLKNVLVFDTFTVANSLDPHHPIPKVNAVLNSLRMHWSGSINRRSHTDCVDAFRGEFITFS